MVLTAARRTVLPVVLFVATLIFTSAICPASSVPGDYWQQEVNYRMEITLQPDLRTIDGKIAIDYNNNSPDTLSVIYLKAWPNAIQKDSYADRKQRRQLDYSYASLKPGQEGRLELFELRDGDPFVVDPSAHRSFEFDNSIIAVRLQEPLPPGHACDLVFGFKTTLPSPSRMRMGTVRGVVRAAYWFPQACVYDRVLGWVNAQYLGWGENYGDYGWYDVAITAPSPMIVAATGVCVNEQEMLPPDLRAALDIANFRKPRSEWPVIETDQRATKTWLYLAENVNDFVFSASANWCIDSDTVNGVEVVAYALRHNAERWRDAALLGVQSIETYSDLFLPYQWPVIRICDAYSGMEYPMLTNCEGGSPSPYFALLLYHEIGHQWFMGQIGSNQIDRPFLDEGFTTHAEHIAMEKYLGRDRNLNYPRNFYQKAFEPPITDRNQRGFRPLLLLMEQGYDQPMVFSYDRGEEYWPWRVSAYYKSAAMHYSLRSILGDSAYFDAMRSYCADWLFKHPYEEDFLRSMEQSSGLELDEYLRQWYHGDERLDYAYDGMSVDQFGGEYVHEIRLRRPGEFVAPVDLAVIWEQGDTTFYTVAPEGMGFQKPGYRMAPEWKQFRMPNDKYKFTIRAKRRIDKIVVDPHELLMDIDRRNNVAPTFWFIPPTEVRLDNLLYDRTPIDKQAMRIRPDLWYDDINGLQIGVHSHGSFLETRGQHSVDFRWATRSGDPFFDFSIAGPVSFPSRFGYGAHRWMFSDQRQFSSTSYDVISKPKYSRPDQSWIRVELNYLDFDDTDSAQGNRFDPIQYDTRRYFEGQPWDQTSTIYVDLETGWLKTHRYGSLSFEERARVGRYAFSDERRGFFENAFVMTVDFTSRSRTWLSLRAEVLNVSGAPPSQFLRHISRAPAVDRFTEAPVFRSPGTFPTDWEDDFYLAERRVRGYQDRTVFVTEAVGGSLEYTPPDLLPFRWFNRVPWIGSWLARTDNLVFLDAAAVTMNGKEAQYPEPIASNETSAYGTSREWYVSAGPSFTFPPFWKGGRHRVRIDFPIYLNHPAPGEKETDFRFSVAWLVAGGL
ncbi:MAG: M1 family metallopeptidase [candidate division Zixibacteria bacterium]|jgi:hypothetical protein|nr:M1 family metallopeptidase [candidate division Zixibacteria bacterium]